VLITVIIIEPDQGPGAYLSVRTVQNITY